MKKLVKFLVIRWVLFFVIVNLFLSCNSEDEMRISPVNEDSKDCVVQGNYIILNYPLRNERVDFCVVGAKGEISFISTSDEKVLSAGWNSTGIYLCPLSVGRATVTIEDESGNQLIVCVEILFQEEKYVVEEYEFNIQGHRPLTKAEKSVITEKAESLMPTRINGGYQFIFTDWKQTEGVVNMYPYGWEKEYIVGTFKRFYVNGSNWMSYELKFEDKTLYFNSFSQNGDSYYLTQTLLPQFLDEYPFLMVLDATQRMSILYRR